jgi:hypothetical protein
MEKWWQKKGRSGALGVMVAGLNSSQRADAAGQRPAS